MFPGRFVVVGCISYFYLYALDGILNCLHNDKSFSLCVMIFGLTDFILFGIIYGCDDRLGRLIGFD